MSSRKLKRRASSGLSRRVRPRRALSRYVRRRRVSRMPFYRSPARFWQGAPPRVYVQLKAAYLENAAPAATTTQYLIDLNSMKDPFETKAATQPNLYDQWAAIYTRGTVISGTVSVFWTDGSAGGNPTSVGMYFDTNGSHIGTTVDFTTIAGCVYGVTTSNENRHLILTKKFDCASLLGRPIDPEGDSTELNVGDPANLCYGHVCLSNTAENIVGQITIRISYNVILSQPNKYHAQSS